MSWATSFAKVITFGLVNLDRKPKVDFVVDKVSDIPHYFDKDKRAYCALHTVTVFSPDKEITMQGKKAIAEWNASAVRMGIPLSLVWEDKPKTSPSLWIMRDPGGKVWAGESGRTPPEEMQGYNTAMPWAHIKGNIYVKDGVNGDELLALLEHEIGHFLGLPHAPEGHYVMSPKALVAKLQPADDQTFYLSTKTRENDREIGWQGV